MNSLRAVTRRAALAVFLLFALAVFVVGPVDASRTTTDARSSLASISAPSLAPSSSHELASLELPLLEPLASVDAAPRFGFAEDLTLLDVEARPCGFELFGGVGTRRCALTYARNNPVTFIDPFGLKAECVGDRCTDGTTVIAADPAAEAARRALLELRLMRLRSNRDQASSRQGSPATHGPGEAFPLYDWGSFGVNSWRGLAGFSDGVFLFGDPLAALGAYDPDAQGVGGSQFVGAATRDLMALGATMEVETAIHLGLKPLAKTPFTSNVFRWGADPARGFHFHVGPLMKLKLPSQAYQWRMQLRAILERRVGR